MVFGFHSIAHR